MFDLHATCTLCRNAMSQDQCEIQTEICDKNTCSGIMYECTLTSDYFINSSEEASFLECAHCLLTADYSVCDEFVVIDVYTDYSRHTNESLQKKSDDYQAAAKRLALTKRRRISRINVVKHK